MSSQPQTRQAEAVPVWLPDLELGVKYRRGKGKEGVLGKASVEATATTELFQRAVFGRFLSVLPGGHRSMSPNHRVVQLVGFMGQGRARGWLYGSAVDPWVAFWWVFFLGVVPVAHPDFAMSEPGRKLLLQRALCGGWIQLKRGQESRFCPGKSMLVPLVEEKICREEWKAMVRLAEGLGRGL